MKINQFERVQKKKKKNYLRNTTEWARRSTRTCARNLYLTILTIGICTIQNPSWRMRCTLGFWDTNQSSSLAILPDQRIVNKKERICRIVDFSLLVDDWVKIKESEKKDIYQDLAREQKKKPTIHEGDGDTNCNWYPRNNPQRFHKRTWRLGNQRTSGDNSDYNIKISLNTEKGPGDFRRLAVTWAPVKIIS